MEHCDICGKEYPEVYHVPDEIWAKITPKEGEYGTLCIECADKKAQTLGIVLYWSANEDDYDYKEIERLGKEVRRVLDEKVDLVVMLGKKTGQMEKEIEYWQKRASKLADDKIKLRNLLDKEIDKDIEEVLEKMKRKKT